MAVDPHSKPLLQHSPRHDEDEATQQIPFSLSYSSRRANPPPPHPLSIFSLAGLRNIFFRRTVTLIPQRESYGTIPIIDRENEDLERQSQSSEATEVEDDDSEKKNGSDWGKFDARTISDATVHIYTHLSHHFI